jgi:hypothetical protein
MIQTKMDRQVTKAKTRYCLALSMKRGMHRNATLLSKRELKKILLQGCDGKEHRNQGLLLSYEYREHQSVLN